MKYVIETGTRGEFKLRMRSFKKCCENKGYVVSNPPEFSIQNAQEIFKNKDGIAFAYGSGMGYENQKWKHLFDSIEIPFLIQDLGYLNRADSPEDAVGYNQLGIGKLCWTPPTSTGERFKALNLTVAPTIRNPSNGKYILVIGQVPNDTQHHLDAQELTDWLAVEAMMLQKKYGLPLVWRPHPKYPSLNFGLKSEVHYPQQYSLRDDIAEAALVLTYNSTTGIECMLSGVRVHCHPSAHYAPHANGSLEVRRGYLERLADAQWLASELEDGSALAYIEKFFQPDSSIPKEEERIPETKKENHDQKPIIRKRNRRGRPARISQRAKIYKEAA